MNITMEVKGMQCGKCADRVKDAVKSVVEAGRVDVDLSSKLVSINHANKGKERIKKAIEDLGFEVKLVTDAPPHAKPRKADRECTWCTGAPQANR